MRIGYVFLVNCFFKIAINYLFMKKFTLFICLFCFTFTFSQTESTNNLPTSYKRWTVKLGLNMVESTGQGAPFKGFSTNAKTSPFALGIEYSFNEDLAVSLFQSTNKWEANKDLLDGRYPTEDVSYFSIDAGLKFYFDQYIVEQNWLDLYLEGGLGLVSVEETGISGNLGLGGIIWISETFGVNAQGIGKFAGKENSPTNHFQYFAGIVFKFGGRDTDNDGIIDDEDDCPNTFGLIQFNGCPDTDGDGVRESLDECPLASGPIELNGCPDQDNDGVADKNDECPNTKGSTKTRGCPDKDNDGIADKFDRCPEVPGSANNRGCPWKDTDKDGVIDKNDKCPNQIGPVKNNGCPYPKLSQVEKQNIDAFAKTILFDLGKADLRQVSFEILNGVVSIMNKYANERFHIAGHTDNTFTKEFNLTLSQNRANAVRNYLISKGIEPSRLTSKGYGEERPVNSNDMEEGRKENRRVEIILIR